MSFDPTDLTSVPDTDQIYIQGLPTTVTEKDIEEFFGGIGVIKDDKKKKCKKIWIYRDKGTGEVKGDATVTYEDPFAAVSAVTWFNDKPFKGGDKIQVSLSRQKNSALQSYNEGGSGGGYRRDYKRGGGGGYGRGGGGGYGGGDGGYGGGGGGGRYGDRDGGGGGYGGGGDRYGDRGGYGGGRGGGGRGGGRGGPPMKDGDWACGACGNVNWARRDRCNQCSQPKPGQEDGPREGRGGGYNERGDGGDRRRGRADEQYDDYGRLKRRRDDRGYDDRR